MDIKEMIKYQMVSRMGTQHQANGHQNTSSSADFKSMLIQFFMFVLMALIDDITKLIPKICNDIKTHFTGYCTEKVKQTIDIKSKQLIDTSITLSTRHDVAIFNMTRIFTTSNSSSSSSSSKQEEGSEESNGMVDALIAHVSKLNNIPMLKLINKGQIMMTYKDKPIQVTNDIFLKIDAIDMSAVGALNSIKISLLSNTLSSAELAQYVKNMYANYLQEIKNSLGDKIYYFDQKSQNSQRPSMPINTDNSAIRNHKQMLISTAPKQLSFTMAQFYSNKKFSNIYGEEVRLIEKRIKFFLERRDWYDSKGIPYQIGLLLSGMPGAGKTSIIRAIANMTRRHIVNVNFANITTATQLKNLFYSDRIQVYKDSSMNDTQSYFIPVDQRIYVLEEIDAIGDIVKQRTNDDESNSKISINDELTLMEILTVLDGTMETPGRIVIMTSNHPEVLDRALIRPGRIDVKAHFGYARKELIAEMYQAYFDKIFPVSDINRLPDKMLSPAEVGQILFKHFDDLVYEKVILDLYETARMLNRIIEKSEPEHNPETISSDLTIQLTPNEDKKKNEDKETSNNSCATFLNQESQMILKSPNDKIYDCEITKQIPIEDYKDLTPKEIVNLDLRSWPIMKSQDTIKNNLNIHESPMFAPKNNLNIHESPIFTHLDSPYSEINPAVAVKGIEQSQIEPFFMDSPYDMYEKVVSEKTN